MKKILTVLTVASVFFCFVSCNKNCKCTTTMGGVSVTETFSKDELKSEYGIDIDKCSDLNMEMEAVGVKMKIKCK